MTVKKYIKRLFGIIFGKLFFRLFRFVNRKRLTIIYYHRVVEKEDLPKIHYGNMCIDRFSFEGQMKFLRDFYNPVGEKEIAAFKTGKKLPENPVWVTFDDGYKDNFEKAYPILKKYKIPATFFVTTGFINRQIVPPEGRAVKNDIANLFMNWDEVKDMADNGLCIGCHTVSHKILASLSKDDVINEISRSKDEIEKRIARKVISFAYPRGKRRDCNLSAAIPVLKDSGFLVAVTTIGGNNSLNFDKAQFELKRIGVSHDDTLDFFKFKVATSSFWQSA